LAPVDKPAKLLFEVTSQRINGGGHSGLGDLGTHYRPAEVQLALGPSRQLDPRIHLLAQDDARVVNLSARVTLKPLDPLPRVWNRL
jgi:hypothetical protein